jgi:hypothetical protein
MHNRLIFRYHHVRVHSNPWLLRGCLRLRPVANRPTGRRKAVEGRRKVAEPRRWLSSGKCVGRGLGKSGPHEA